MGWFLQKIRKGYGPAKKSSHCSPQEEILQKKTLRISVEILWSEQIKEKKKKSTRKK